MSNTTFVDNELPYYLQHRQSTLLRDLTLNNRQKQLALGPGHPEECLLPRHGLIRSLLKGARLSRYPAAAPVATAVLRFRVYKLLLRNHYSSNQERLFQDFATASSSVRKGKVNQRPKHQGFFFRKRTQPSGEDSRSIKVPNTRVSLFGREHNPAERTAGRTKSQTPGFLFPEDNTTQRRGSRSIKVPNTRVSLFGREHSPAEDSRSIKVPHRFPFSGEHNPAEDSRSIKVPNTRVSFRKRTQPSGEDSRSTKVHHQGFFFRKRTHPAERTAGQSKSQTPGFLFSEENTAQRRGQQVNQSPKHQGFSFRKRTQPSGEDSRSTKVPTTRVSFAEGGGVGFFGEDSRRFQLQQQIRRGFEKSFFEFSSHQRRVFLYPSIFVNFNRTGVQRDLQAFFCEKILRCP
ncbi:hypothetical protein J6590_106553 [Homalodisca vitripennis]|nr:hypothetical protein J6590_106553 [Homalodisca vitripennis]